MRALALLALAAAGCATAPPAPVPATPDLLSALTAAGVEQPKGLDWDAATRLKPAAQVFKNVPLLGAVNATRFMAGMQSMKPALGLRCPDCHERENYAADSHAPKVTARSMLSMNLAINDRFFGGEVKVTCFTCHQGEAKPPGRPPSEAVRAPKTPLRELSAEEAAKPSKEVYQHLEVIGDLPAGSLPKVMGILTAALGANCEDCHAPGGDWANDSPRRKQIARKMMQMSNAIDREWFERKGRAGCYACHRGHLTPPRR
jgi:photosynthetic reaction center cytochrome c subunit